MFFLTGFEFPHLCEADDTVETKLNITQSALDVHMECTPFVKD